MEPAAAKAAAEYLEKGCPPPDDEILLRSSAGISFLTDFLRDQYLKDYIPAGGSKIKFVTGRSGSGKTHFGRLMRAAAESTGFLTVTFSARDIWLHDFSVLYLEILRQCSLEHVLKGCADQIIREMGDDPSAIPEGQTYMDHLSDKGEADAITRSSIREALRSRFTRNPRLDNNFALCCSLLTGSILGHPVLEATNEALLLSWLYGDRTVKFSQLRALGLSPARITKFNARNMLRSLCETVKLGGHAGIFVFADDLEILLNRTGSDHVRYTKLRRDDTYESIRQLIDDIDSMRYLFFLFGFDRELADNENSGLKSYQALWMRIQSEVSGTRFNRFADILDLDALSDQIYTPEVMCEMAVKLSGILSEAGTACHPLSEEKALTLADRARYGGLGLPLLVNQYVVKGDGDDV